MVVPERLTKKRLWIFSVPKEGGTVHWGDPIQLDHERLVTGLGADWRHDFVMGTYSREANNFGIVLHYPIPEEGGAVDVQAALESLTEVAKSLRREGLLECYRLAFQHHGSVPKAQRDAFAALEAELQRRNINTLGKLALLKL